VTARAPRHARPFVAAFLAMLVVCALAPLNLWPFSSWELFSRLRSDRVSAWEAVAVEDGRSVRALSFQSLPRVARSERLAFGERDAVCDWLLGPRMRFGEHAAQVRIYHLERVLSNRHGERAAAPSRTRVWTCTARDAA
jgi:hypothetical protein